MNEEDRRHFEELLRTNKRRFRLLERRKAELGLSTPPEILSEMEDIRAEITRIEGELGRVILTTVSTSVTELRRQALKAYFSKEWGQAISLLAQVIVNDPGDDDARDKLTDARRQVRLQEEYQVICELRDEDRWQAVLDALDDLNGRQPRYPDPEGLRTWADRRRTQANINNQRQGSVDKTDQEDMQTLRNVKMISNFIRNNYPSKYHQDLQILDKSNYKLNPRLTGSWQGKWSSKNEDDQYGSAKITMYQINNTLVGIGSLSNSLFEDVYLEGKLEGRKIIIEFFTSDIPMPCILNAFLKGNSNLSIYGNYEVFGYDYGEFEVKKVEKDV